MYNKSPEKNKEQYLRHKIHSKHIVLNNKAKRESIFIIDNDNKLTNYINKNIDNENLKLLPLNKLIQEIEYIADFYKPMLNLLDNTISQKKDVYYEYLQHSMKNLTENDIRKIQYIYMKYNEIPDINKMSFFNKMTYLSELNKMGYDGDIINEKIQSYKKLRKLLDSMGYKQFSVKDAIENIKEMRAIFTPVDYQYKIKKVFEKYNIDVPERELTEFIDILNKKVLLDQDDLIDEKNKIVQKYFNLDNDSFSKEEILLAKNLLQQDCNVIFLRNLINHIVDPYIIKLDKDYFNLYFEQLNEHYYQQKIDNYEIMQEEIDFAFEKIKNNSNQLINIFDKCKNVFGIDVDKDISLLSNICKYRVYDNDIDKQYDFIRTKLAKTNKDIYEPINVEENISDNFRNEDIQYFDDFEL